MNVLCLFSATLLSALPNFPYFNSRLLSFFTFIPLMLHLLFHFVFPYFFICFKVTISLRNYLKYYNFVMHLKINTCT